MKHTYNYIIKITNELNETFKTESGLELYGHQYFNKDRLSNRFAVIIGHPIFFEGEILEEGIEVLIDPSCYYHSTHGEDDIIHYTTNTIDRKNGIYAIEPENIVAYKSNDTWHGYMGNFIGECVKNKIEDKKLGSLIVEVGKTEKTDNYKVVYTNPFLKENQVNTGDVLFMKPQMGVSIWLDGKEYTWLRAVDVLAKINEDDE